MPFQKGIGMRKANKKSQKLSPLLTIVENLTGSHKNYLPCKKRWKIYQVYQDP